MTLPLSQSGARQATHTVKRQRTDVPQPMHEVKRQRTDVPQPVSEVKRQRSDIDIDMQRPRQPDIGEALTRAATDPDATILVAGYSPTGGGHTGRMLKIIEKASDEGTLAPGSVVVLHVPQKWEKNGQDVARPASLERLANRLQEKGITVVVAEADKSVIGYLRRDGSSDDPRILQRLADMPLRPDAATESVLQSRLYTGAGTVDWQNLQAHSISAKDLMNSIRDTIDPGPRRARSHSIIEEKVKVLTDMDPALQKAAREIGVPAHNRLDQQNHGIMIRPGDDHHNLAPANSFLAKVLSGMGERVSHIGLGDRNPFLDLKDVAQRQGVNESTTRAQALLTVSRHIMDHRNGLRFPLGEDQAVGTLMHRNLVPEQVQNVIYVYAHNHTNRIANFIHAQIDNEHADEAYRNTLFVFCGQGALAEGGEDGMRMGNLADGDAIMTAGAGTVGEFAYLSMAGEARAHVMLLPIAGHNEQEVNAGAIAENNQVRSTIIENTDQLEIHLNAFIEARGADAAQKYDDTTLRPLIEAINRETYVDQAHEMLFPTRQNRSPTPAERVGVNLAQTEQTMRNNLTQKMNRKYVKMTLQVLDQVGRALAADEDLPERVHFKLNKKDQEFEEYTLADFSEMISNDGHLTEALNSRIDLNAANLARLNQTRNLFAAIRVEANLRENPGQILAEIDDLKTHLGHYFTTGF